MNRPDPPAATETVEELSSSFATKPDEWLIYLRNSEQYMLYLEGKLESTRVEKDTQERAAQASISERDGIIRYQKDQLTEGQQRITQLEIEKVQLATAATPAVQTPRTDTVTAPAPVAAAEAHADDPTRPFAPATAPRSGTSSLSEKIPDPKEFD